MLLLSGSLHHLPKINMDNWGKVIFLVFARKQEGEKDLFSFLTKNTGKTVQELIERVWSMHGAAEKENSQTISRTEKLVSTENKEFIAIWKWEVPAICTSCTFLEQYQKFVFPATVNELLQKNRKKRPNICLVGWSDCGKSFLLEPLEQIFNCFANPAQDKYVWTGLDEADVAYINNFCWSNELIAWQELLNLLKGAPCKLSRPKNVFATDRHILSSNTIIIFATEIRPIECVGAYGLRDERETVMMDSRWRIFEFSHQIASNDIQEIPACSRCFHDLVMLGSAN